MTGSSSQSGTAPPFSLAPSAQAADEACEAWTAEFARRHAMPSQDSRSGRACLESVIEGEVIPRLLVLSRPGDATARAVVEAAVPDVTPADTPPAVRKAPLQLAERRLCALLLAEDLPGARRALARHLKSGHSPQDLMIGLLAPTARLLGKMWEDDEADFVKVTVALSHLRVLFQELRGQRAVPPQIRAEHGPMLLTALPGEQHTFGLHIAAESLERAGVTVATLIPFDLAELETTARQQDFEFVGFSLGSEGLLDSLASAIERVRKASSSPSVRVLVGGPVISVNPSLAVSIDAECVTGSLGEAIAFVVGSSEQSRTA